MKRLYVEKKPEFDVKAKILKKDILNVLNIDLSELRILLRYDIEGLSEEDFQKAKYTVFSEPPCDNVYEQIDLSSYSVIAVQYLPGQYDQRADFAEQCVQLLTQKERPKIACANIYAVKDADDVQIQRIKKYLINPVECCEASLDMPESLETAAAKIKKVKTIEGFIGFSPADIEKFHKENGFAMSIEDLKFVQSYFRQEKRDPTETELKVIDTYWSDHCRHTTFLTEIKDVIIEGGEDVKKAYNLYKELYKEINGERKDKYPCLMDVATIAAKKLKVQGKLSDLDESDEINACSINVKANIDGREEDWLVMFKNETHNHPTEIEPFGGAATCLGGAIRDPLSGRTYVYQSMRVTGSGNPLASYADTIEGKLPQRVITKGAAEGYSSYGNQIGLATGMVSEIYHDGYIAKRLEAGYVIGAAPKSNVYREKPKSGDVVVLLGGDTGRDGCGGATGSSKAHTLSSIEECGAEVQKGNPLTERKIQRLFRKGEVTRLIKKCNDFGAGGVSVAIGELADSLLIDLDAVPKKYSGLNGTELAISESQERMAVMLSADNAQKFIDAAKEENLKATVVARVTDTRRMQMVFQGEMIVDISRDFLNTNGVKQQTTAVIDENKCEYIYTPSNESLKHIENNNFSAALSCEMSRLNVCLQKGLIEMFDSTVGSGTIYMPLGGKYQLTPAIAMAAKLPAMSYTDTCTVSSYACYPHFARQNAFAAGVATVASAAAKLIACGAERKNIRLSMQEYFKRLHKDPRRWGQPLAALLGALWAQIGLQTPAIGGKDSMSGSFENLDVPPTLICFSAAAADANNLITNVIQNAGQKIYALPLRYNNNCVCDLDYASKLFDAVSENIKNKNIYFATVAEEGGIAAAAVKSCLGNGFGFEFDKNNSLRQLFSPVFGTIIVSAKDIEKLRSFDIIYIGQSVTGEKGFIYNGCGVSFDDIKNSALSVLENVFPINAEGAYAENIEFIQKANSVSFSAQKFARPSVFIPVFPGTNCEYDTAKRFAEQGANVCEFVIKNASANEIEQSVKTIAQKIKNCQIIAFPGGFSGGDEPDGSGKFIATVFRHPLIAESVTDLIENRKGLILGICNGFQALIKMGLLPYGKYSVQKEDSPTLTFNNISRHISALVTIRVSSNNSPWLSGVNVGEIYTVPVSHGEGRFYCSRSNIETMIENGQIATQYADFDGNAAGNMPHNPNGSYYAVEGIISPCGRIFGKMGHSERYEKNLYKNCSGSFDMKIFESGIKYFR